MLCSTKLNKRVLQLGERVEVAEVGNQTSVQNVRRA